MTLTVHYPDGEKRTYRNVRTCSSWPAEKKIEFWCSTNIEDITFHAIICNYEYFTLGVIYDEDGNFIPDEERAGIEGIVAEPFNTFNTPPKEN
jgi:hypothetical protein